MWTYRGLLRIGLIFTLCLAHNASATPDTTVIPGVPETQTFTFYDPAKGAHATWIFDFAAHPNYAALLNSAELISAMLTFTLTSQRLDLNAAALKIEGLADGLAAASQRHLSVQTVTTVEVNLFDMYSPQELLQILTTTNGKLPVRYGEELSIVTAQLQLTTKAPLLSARQLLVSLVFVMIFGLLGYMGWRQRRSKLANVAVIMNLAATVKPPLREKRLALVGKQASAVMHDIKNSLAGMRSCAEVIGSGELEPHERTDFAKLLMNEIDRGVAMTQEILEFSRGRQEQLHLEPLTVAAFFQDLLAMIGGDLARQQIVIRTDFQYGGVFQVDVKKMQRAWLNLIGNAKDAMPDGGALTLTARLGQEGLQLEVIDTGCGMSPELQARAFEPFVTEGKAHGTGLGMAIVKDILDAHHARIEIRSAVGQGTTIRIIFPQTS